MQQCQLQSAGGGQLPDLTRSGEHIGLLDDVDEEREEYFDELDESSRHNSMEGRRTIATGLGLVPLRIVVCCYATVAA